MEAASICYSLEPNQGSLRFASKVSSCILLGLDNCMISRTKFGSVVYSYVSAKFGLNNIHIYIVLHVIETELRRVTSWRIA
jgi:hypothetical protein